MRLRDDVDLTTVNWRELAAQTFRYAWTLPPGVMRRAEMDSALACEALARSGALLKKTDGMVRE